jgi:16S rRNA (uracil1498-N3)-methyltransferase
MIGPPVIGPFFAMPHSKPKVRLFVDAALGAGAEVGLDAGQAHYLVRVMRLGPGDAVLVFNGRDGEWQAHINDTGTKRQALAIDSQTRRQAAEPGPWLAFAPLKKTPMDFVAVKATELGVSRLLPVFTQLTAARRVATARLRANAREAAEQCGRLSVPEVAGPVDLEALIAAWPGERRLLVPDESGGGVPLAQVLAKATDGDHAFLIGPEGGFAPDELDALRKLPFVTAVGLGPRILRAETAALAALACWQALVGDWDTPPPRNSLPITGF